MELHGGKIQAESQGIGKGAKFGFTLKVFGKKDLEKVKEKQQAKPQISLAHSQI